MPRFFTDWATWEKLCFVLACAIAVTLFGAVGKLLYTRVTLRKYAVVAEQEKEDRAIQRQLSLFRKSSQHEGNELAFGIEALEKGIKVEGVWDSRSNTPEPVSRRQSRDFSHSYRVPPFDQGTNLVRQDTLSLADSKSRPTSSRYYDEPTSLPTLAHSIHDQSSDATKPHGSHHQSFSMSRFNVRSDLSRQDSGVSTIRSTDAIYESAWPVRESTEGTSPDHVLASNESSVPSSHGSSDAEPIAASAPHLLNHHHRSRQPSSDLDLMNSHRTSQAAETGQLRPRSRKPGQSGDWAGIVAGLSSASSQPDDGLHVQQQERSPTPVERASCTWSQTTYPPKIDALPAAVRRSSLPDVTPFAKFCQTAASSPISQGTPRNADSTSTMRSQNASRSSSMSRTSSPANEESSPNERPVSTRSSKDLTQAATPQSQPTMTRGTSFEHRAPTILRGHGSGFEILRPGSFSTPAPPISLHNGSGARSRSSSIDGRNKLRKKRRYSNESDMSSQQSFGTSRASVA